MVNGKTSKNADEGLVVLTQIIYDGLRDEIVSGKLKPGERLVRRRIAERYGCSYTPVIEALSRLVYSGLVETESYQTAWVRGLTVEKIHSDYVLREAYETQSIRMACERVTPGEIVDLYRIADELDTSTAKEDTESRFEGGGEGPVIHWRFHRRVAEISRCPVLVRELERIEVLSRLKANWILVEGLPDPPRHHGKLVDLIQSRDSVAADAAMRAHVRRGLEKELAGFWTAQSRK
jgi:DNA-binding GntR family transcriptional regulator